MRTISDAEFAAVCSLPAAERYAHFVKQVADGEEVWSLRNADGWVLSGNEAGDELVPVWPHARYAEACAINEWADCQPGAIPLEHWLSRWTPGMEHDGRQVAVFPTAEIRGVPVTPDVLRLDLETELEQYK